MKTIIKGTETKVISDNIEVRIDEDDERIFVEVLENQHLLSGGTELVITNNLSIPKARELGLELEKD
jgi:hypothetical protein|tara:strand:+ start:168 stop:368 length:201 start_codon:yes stop_codon:yes gene_type:complete